MRNINTFVVAANASGETEIVLVQVKASSAQIDNGEHIEAAMKACSDEDFEPSAAFDSQDPAGRAIKLDAIYTTLQTSIG